MLVSDPNLLRTLAEDFLAGRLSVDHFLQRVGGRIADVGPAQVDIDRARRCGFPEVIYGQGKTPDAMLKIVTALVEHGQAVLATRVSPEQADLLAPCFPQGHYNAAARTFRIGSMADGSPSSPRGRVAVVSAGTSDFPVAEEARETALWTGAEVVFVQDVGVAGPHRLRANLPLIEPADAVVVVAGMEGALPSVVGGYVACPIVAVPTSVGYGAAFGGLAALLGMLNSCASNVTVVNIDAGFKGGYVAGLIARNVATARASAQGGSCPVG